MSTSIIIGFGTLVGGSHFSGVCATSVNWGYNPNVQRLYCLGDTDVWRNVEKPTETLSITMYAYGGPGATSVPASQNCDEVTELNASVSPSSCGDTVDGVSGDWYLTSYSYSKGDPNLIGQETWSMQRWVAGGTAVAPNHYIQAAAEGQASELTGAGIVFADTPLEGTTGSVSAGSTGQASTLYYGLASSVGGGSLGAGEIGNGSASISVTPLWTT